MKKTNQIPEYVFSCLKETATEQEKTDLSKWLTKEGNAEIYSQLRKIDQISSDLSLFHSFNRSIGRKKVQQAISIAKYTKLLHQLQRVAAILFLPLIISCIFFFAQNRLLKDDLLSSSVIQQINTQPGTKNHFFLPDSTEVWLNAASSIKFPSVFNRKERRIELNGEAYFKVYKNKQKPFIVKNGTFEVEALGTAFNLCAYSEDKKFMATLEEGRIRINEKSHNKSIEIKPGEQILFSLPGKNLHKQYVDVEDVIAWKDGRLVFNKTPFSDVIKMLGRWFNADLQLDDPEIANYRYTGTFTSESLSQVMELLKLTAPIDYSTSKRTISQGNTFSKEQIRIQKRE